VETFYVRNGEEFREATREEIIARAQALISQRFRTGATPLSAPHLTEAFLRLHLGALDYEVFGVLHLDARHRLIVAEDMFRGTMKSAEVYPREIAQSVLARRTTDVILYHNHPSGIAVPSQADEMITRKICQVLDLIDVKVLDHLIVGETLFSFASAGMLR
jgi:DNA repair protein RadC